MIFTAILLVLLALYGLWEYRRHQRNVDGVPIRVLVNGTRGKSSVTRLISGGMRQGGIRTLGKTTGTKPRLIFPDGSEQAIVRAGKANIIEQLMVFRRAVALQAEALVTECMAVLPPNQVIMQRQMVRSTVGVITNVRADHLDEMGPAMLDVARTLAQTIPVNGVVYTSERMYLPALREVAYQRNATVVTVSPDTVTEGMMKPFSYLEHKENVALALAVCGHLGISRDKALEGMHRAQPDQGVLRIFTIHHYQKELQFVNAFAANDPDSYLLIWDMLKGFFTEGKRIIVVVNCRQDRVQRTESLADLIARRLRADHFLLVGESTPPLYHKALNLGLRGSRLVDLEGQSADEVFQRVISLAGNEAIIIGIGNIVGFGEELVMNFTNRGKELVY